MRIACISITYEDGYKLNEWYDHYLGYRDDMYIHIIVDNNSSVEYYDKLSKRFPDSHIIRRDTNGGCTGAYNDGIRYALSLAEVDSIFLMANDIKMGEGGIRVLHEALYSDPSLGMVSPLLLYSGSMINSDFGCSISKMLIMQPYCEGMHSKDIKEEVNYCEALTGGVNLAKREFYEKVGLQDEKLFMYSDEVDMGIRSMKNGFKMMAVSKALSWHEHINKPASTDKRESFTKYLAGRNKVYVARKHFGNRRAFVVFGYIIAGAAYKMISNMVAGNISLVKDYSLMMLGAFMGFVGVMASNKYSKPEKDVH